MVPAARRSEIQFALAVFFFKSMRILYTIPESLLVGCMEGGIVDVHFCELWISITLGALAVWLATNKNAPQRML